MRLKKNYKIRGSEETSVLKPKMSKVQKKIQNKNVRSKVDHPKKAKIKPSWIDRLFKKDDNSEESFRVYFETSEGEFKEPRVYFETPEDESKEPVNNIYASQFMHCEHFNLVGEDKKLGPLVLSIKYSSEAANTQGKNGEYTNKTSLLLRLPTGTAHHHWNQFQLSQPSSQSPLSLAKLSFPSLSLGRLVPVLCPEAGMLIAEYDRTCKSVEKVFVESKAWNENKIDEIASSTKQLKKLQEMLMTSTCKFLEFSNWDCDAFDRIFTKIKPNLVPKYLSFNMPNVLKSPNEMKSPKEAKSPEIQGRLGLEAKETSLTNLCLASQPPALLTIKPDGDCLTSSPSTSELPSHLMTDLAVQLLKLSTNNSLEECQDSELDFVADHEKLTKIKFDLIKLKLENEKEKLTEQNNALEKEKEELLENEGRLARELATANIIIESLKERVLR